MYLEVKGGTKTKRKLAESIAKFCATKLMSTRLANTLEITIELVPNLGKKVGVYGDCIWEDKPNRPKEFTVRVDSKMTPRHVVETIAHEMVHVKQFARNELYEPSAKQGSRWKGEWLSPRQKCVKDYWDQPWEIEAHGRECGLFVRWAEKHGYSKKKWAQYDL